MLTIRAMPAPFHWRRTVWLAGCVSLAILLGIANVVGLMQLWTIAPDGSTGDWYYFTLLDPSHPYAFATFFRWAPIAAWGIHLLILPLGWQLWVVLHVAALGLVRDWRVIAVAVLAWPFWEDALNGNVITFVVVLAWCALRGERWAVIGYCALFALMPRPLMVPVLAWLVWQRNDARWALGVAGALVVASSLALGQLDEWIARLLISGADEILSVHNIGPSIWLGAWWLPIGLALGAWFTWRGRLGLASLAVSPYWLSYYLLMGLLEVRPPSARGPTQASFSEGR